MGWQTADRDGSNPAMGENGNPGIAVDTIRRLVLERGWGYKRREGNRMCMDRDLELRIKGHLYEIGTVNDEVEDGRQGFHSSEMGYRKTLESVAAVGGQDLVDEVAAYIKDSIEKQEDRPRNQEVRKKARRMVSKAGYPPDDYLNAA